MANIGDWDTTGLNYALLPPCDYNGSGNSSYNTGYASCAYLGENAVGDETFTLTNCAAGYGFVNSGGNSYFNLDGTNDNIVGNKVINFTNTCKKTFSFYCTRGATGARHSFVGEYKNMNNYWHIFVESDNTIYAIVRTATNFGEAKTTNTIDTNPHLITVVKDGATIKVYIDNVEASYSLQRAYAGGNSSFVGNAAWGRYGGNYWNGKIHWFAYYGDAISADRMTADYTNRATFYGLIGINDAPGTDTVFDSLTAGGTITFNHTKSTVNVTANTHTINIHKRTYHVKSSVVATAKTHTINITGNITFNHTKSSVKATAKTHTVKIVSAPTDDSIKYRIANNIVDTMKTITTANGYKYNVPSGNVFIANVITEIPDPTKPAILVDILNSSPVEDQGHTIVWEYAYMVRFYNVHSTENPSINTDNANVEADVIKALKVDVTRGGLAHYTEAGECSPAFDPEVRAPYHEMVILVLTTINGSNPYST